MTKRKRNTVSPTRKRRRDNDDDDTGAKRTKKRQYSERWHRWRKHLNDTKLANPHLIFGKVLVLASETYDTKTHQPIRSWDI